MADPPQAQLGQLRHSMAVLEGQRARAALLKLGGHGVAAEALAGMARCAFAQGDLEGAKRHASELWAHLQIQGSKATMEMPALTYQTCADIFDALGEPELARAALEAGHRDVMGRAEKISDPEWRKSFLENIPEHRALVDLWERMAGETPRPR